MVGYSRLMGKDEEGTLGRLKALRSELLDPKVAELVRYATLSMMSPYNYRQHNDDDPWMP